MVGLKARDGFVGENRIYPQSNKRKKKRHVAPVVMVFALTMFLLMVSTTALGSNWYVSGNYGGTANHIVINEVYYDAPTGYTEPRCEWIELYNPTAQDIDISGWNITDYEGNWSFPSNTTVSAGGYILVVNDATYKGQFNALFPGVTATYDTNTSNSIPDMKKQGRLSLNNRGDDVHLLNADKIEVDAVWYGNGGNMGPANAASSVHAGHSIARYYDGEDTNNCKADFYDEPSPTPGSPNTQTIPEFNIILPLLLLLIVGAIILRRKS